MIKMVWQCISPEVTVRDFRKYCISIEMDETDDHILWNDGDEGGDVRKTKALTV